MDAQGWRPCLGRDVFFGAIYFPLYNNVKKKLTATDKPGMCLQRWRASTMPSTRPVLMQRGVCPDVYREATVLDALAAGLVAVSRVSHVSWKARTC
eukprot:122198-Rhodomonas_salina.1